MRSIFLHAKLEFMASSSEKRKGYWDEKEEEEEESLSSKRGGAGGVKPKGEEPRSVDSQGLAKKIQEATALLEQTHQLYLLYFNGIEKRPPAEKVIQLDAKALELQKLATQGVSHKFKVTQYIQHFNSLKELWARKLREKEHR